MENVCVGHGLGQTKRESITFLTNSEIKWLHDTNVINVAMLTTTIQIQLQMPEADESLTFLQRTHSSLSSLSLKEYYRWSIL